MSGEVEITQSRVESIVSKSSAVLQRAGGHRAKNIVHAAKVWISDTCADFVSSWDNDVESERSKSPVGITIALLFSLLLEMTCTVKEAQDQQQLCAATGTDHNAEPVDLVQPLVHRSECLTIADTDPTHSTALVHGEDSCFELQPADSGNRVPVDSEENGTEAETMNAESLRLTPLQSVCAEEDQSDREEQSNGRKRVEVLEQRLAMLTEEHTKLHEEIRRCHKNNDDLQEKEYIVRNELFSARKELRKYKESFLAVVSKASDLQKENKGLVADQKNLLSENQSLLDEKRAILNENQSLFEEKKSLVYVNRGLVEENQSLLEEKKGLVEESKELLEANLALSKQSEACCRPSINQRTQSTQTNEPSKEDSLALTQTLVGIERMCEDMNRTTAGLRQANLDLNSVLEPGSSLQMLPPSILHSRVGGSSTRQVKAPSAVGLPSADAGREITLYRPTGVQDNASHHTDLPQPSTQSRPSTPSAAHNPPMQASPHRQPVQLSRGAAVLSQPSDHRTVQEPLAPTRGSVAGRAPPVGNGRSHHVTPATTPTSPHKRDVAVGRHGMMKINGVQMDAVANRSSRHTNGVMPGKHLFESNGTAVSPVKAYPSTSRARDGPAGSGKFVRLLESQDMDDDFSLGTAWPTTHPSAPLEFPSENQYNRPCPVPTARTREFTGVYSDQDYEDFEDATVLYPPQ